MYKRSIKTPQNKSFFLFGPRGTGKTTWVKNNFPNALYIDLLEAETYNELLANPQRLEKMTGKFNGFPHYSMKSIVSLKQKNTCLS